MIEKNVFTVRKVSLAPARVRLPTSLRRASQQRLFARDKPHSLGPLRREQAVNRFVADPTAAVFSSEKNPGEDARTLLVEPRM